MDNPKTLEKKIVRLDELIPFLAGRPNREMAINDDDLLNLTILLNTAKSLEEFLESI
jgi:hypothetical protein